MIKANRTLNLGKWTLDIGMQITMLFLLLFGLTDYTYAGNAVFNGGLEAEGRTATFREDRNGITVIDFAGNYDVTINDIANRGARAVIAQEFYAEHVDEYDFLVVFSTFDFEQQTPDGINAAGLHWGIQNNVTGTGHSIFDDSASFGSNGRLLSYIDGMALDNWVTDPLDPHFENVLGMLGHEVIHQWSGRARFDQGNGVDNSLIGAGDSHWSDLFDTGASVLEGHDWHDHGNGTFTAEANSKFFSPLDLYMAGFYSADEVHPMLLIENNAINARVYAHEGLRNHGPTISGNARTITIDDIIAAEGPRIPAVESAQKHYRFGFVLLTRQGDRNIDASLRKINNIRRTFVDRFAIWTGGRGTASAFPETKPDIELGNPELVSGSAIRADGTDISAAFTWLREQQNIEGFWRDKDTTIIRDTSVVAQILNLYDPFFARRADALDWLQNRDKQNTDYLARHILALNELGRNAEAIAIGTLLAEQNTDGGWGLDASYDSNALDTALAVLALANLDDISTTVMDKAADFLLSQRNADGGWGNNIHSPSRTTVSTTVVEALRQINRAPATTELLAFFASRQNTDGGFGDSPSTVHDTANVINILTNLQVLDQVRVDDATSYLLTRQGEDGDWNGSTYATALAARALQKLSVPNWVLQSFTASSLTPNDGEVVTLTISIKNDTNVATPATVLRLLDGITQIGSDVTIPSLLPGQPATLTLYWDTFDVAPGLHELRAIIDPDNTQLESSERDNQLSKNLTVGAIPSGLDIAILTNDAIATPSNPDSLPVDLSFSATVRNLGLTDAGNVIVQLRADSAIGEVLDQQSINLPARGSSAVNFSYTLTNPGVRQYVLIADPDNQLNESREDNNSFTLSVATTQSLDIAVQSSDISADKPGSVIGEDIAFNITLRNRGTVNSPSFNVRYSISDGSTVTPLSTSVAQVDAGQTTTQTVVWRADRQGSFTLLVEVDPENLLPESNESNNVTSFAFTGGEATGPNLLVSFADLTFAPDPGEEGRIVTLSALVRNTGSVAASDVAVWFYSGDPDNGGELIAQASNIVNLDAGSEVTVTADWLVPDAADKVLFVVVDPDNVITEFSEDDNRAFNTLEILSLADLAVGTADISLSTAAPMPGDTVTVSAVVNNLGEQAEQDIVVRFFAGDPDLSGQLLGESLIDLDGNSNRNVSANFTFTGDEAITEIYVLVDPDDAIAEAMEVNNIAMRRFALQAGDFVVSERFFSPNGDGVKDTTEFFYRTDENDIRVEIALVDDNAIVRSITPGNGNGSIIWDGLDDLGRVVNDGNYQLQVLNANDEVLGSASVIIDNNRAALSSALQSGNGIFSNLTCDIYDHDFNYFVVAENEELIIFTISGASPADVYADGLYRMSRNGADIQLLIPGFIPEVPPFSNIVLSPDNNRLAFIGNVNGDLGLWVMNTDGSNLVRADTEATSGTAIVTFTDNNDIIYRKNGGLYRRDLDNFQEQLIIQFIAGGGPGGPGGPPGIGGGSVANAFEIEYALSPDNTKLLFNPNDGFNQELLYVNLQTGQSIVLDSGFVFNASTEWKYSWSPDGKHFAVISDSANRVVNVYDTQGSLVSSQPWPLLPQNNELTVLQTPRWSNTGTEFAFQQYNTLEFGDSAVPDAEYGFGGLFTYSLISQEYTFVNDFELQDANRRPSKNDINTGSAAFFVSLAPNAQSFLWLPNEQTLLYTTVANKPVLIALDNDNAIESLPLFANISTDSFNVTAIGNLFFRQASIFSGSGIAPCADGLVVPDILAGALFSGDYIRFANLQNLTVDLRAIQSTSQGGVLLDGTATDLYFDKYQLDYAPFESPDDWRPIQPTSSQAVIDEHLTTWVPPAIGSYLIRLIAFDQAGNQRQVIRRVSWGSAVTLTDVSRSPAIFSPNSDGVMDVSNVQYRVLAPVHLEFNFYNESEDLVRTIIRDHATPNQSFNFDWDGRDNNGLPLPDGRYRMTVQNYEYFFEIDATPPQINLTLEDAYQFSIDDNNQEVVLISPSLAWFVADPLYKNASIKTSLLSSPDDIADFENKSFLNNDVNSQSFLNFGQFNFCCNAYNIEQLQFTLRAEDEAGNVSVTTVGPVAEQLIISHYGGLPYLDNIAQQRVYLFKDLYAKVVRPDYQLLGATEGIGIPSVLNDNRSVPLFSLVETIRAELSNLQIQFRLDGTDNWVNFEPELDNNYILTDPSAALNDKSLFGFTQPLSSATEINATANAYLPDFPAGGVYHIRLYAIDNEGNEFYSNVVLGEITEENKFDNPRLLGRKNLSEYEIGVNSDSSFERLKDVKFTIKSNTDPRYYVAQEFDEQFDASNTSTRYKTAADLSACQTYEVTVTGRDELNNYFIKNNIEIPCVEVFAKTEPVFAETCNTVPNQQVKISLAPYSGDDSKLSLLTLAPASNPDDVLFNINDPASVKLGFSGSPISYPYEYTVNTDALAEGSVLFIAKLINDKNQESILPVRVIIDKTAPVLSINYPQENASVCAVPYTFSNTSGEFTNNTVTIDGTITDKDRHGIYYELSLLSKTGFQQFHGSLGLNSFSASGRTDLAQTFNNRNVTGALGELAQLDGQQTIRLAAYDKGSFKQCLDRTFTVDSSVLLNSTEVDKEVFSPNDDGLEDTVTLTYSVAESVSVDVDIYRTNEISLGTFIRTDEVVRNLVTDFTLNAAVGQSEWDGRDDLGDILADGRYEIVMTFTDNCGFTKESSYQLNIDNTAPVIAIDFPIVGAIQLPLIVEVQGSIDDPYIQGWKVEFGQGDTPENWVEINADEGNVSEALLASWNTFNLVGPYVIRVTATDNIANTSSVNIPVNVALPLNIISDLEAVESLFSPNNNGLRDNTAIRINLEQAATLTVEIRNNNDNALRTLTQEQNVNAGPLVINWDGLNNTGDATPDGKYKVYVLAALQSNPLVRQEETITVELDATAPLINITNPVNGYISGDGFVLGDITDTNIDEYEVFISDNPNAPIWQLLRSGKTPLSNTVIASLNNLEEGDYALRIVATDLAETQTEVIYPFIVDNTKPIVELLTPEDNVFINATKLHDIRGNFEEDNPATYSLSYQLDGTGPVVEIVSDSVFPFANPITQWDVSSVPDGLYVLTLTVTDLAGLSDSASSNINIDKTAPVAVIDMPLNGSFVNEGDIISGTATDVNIEQYQLFIAPGAIGSSTQFTEIDSRSLSVDNSSLGSWKAVAADGLYTLRLTVTDKANNVSITETEVLVDTTPPAKPVGVAVNIENDVDVVLSWNANTETDLAGYLVFRDGEQLTSTPIVNTRYTDITVSATSPVYTVIAVDRATLQSEPSDSIRVAIDNEAPTVNILSPIDGSKVSGLVDIRGTASSADDFARYRVYIATDTDPENRQLLRESPAPIIANSLSDWNTLGLTEGQAYIITLEAEDINDNLAANSITVTIDNTAPAQPTGLAATIAGSTVQLNWSTNSETDLAGYLLFRNGKLANATGNVLGDLSPFIINTNSYTDENVVDGTHEYTVVAVDDASNLSEASLPTEAFIDTRAPQALIVQPTDGSRFAVPIYLLATSVDLDVANVQFEYRTAGAPVWNTIGVINQYPFGIDFDPVASGLTLGNYEFRAIATDNNNQTDNNPAVITLIYADLQRPDQPANLVAQVNGAEVTLNWDANSEADFAEYRIIRTGVLPFPTELNQTVNSFLDSGLAVGGYNYSIVAIDNNGNESDPAETLAQVYTPAITTIAPTVNATEQLHVTGISAGTLSVSISNSLGTINLPAVVSANNEFVLDIDLATGINTVSVSITDNNGNISLPASIDIERLLVPTKPTGLVAVVNSFDVQLNWDSNPESNVVGYHVIKDGIEIATIPFTSYIDRTIDGRYEYTVIAVTDRDIMSEPSETVIAEVGDVVAPDTVVLTGSLIETDIQLNWTASTAPDFANYDIYLNNNLWRQIGDISSLSLLETNLPAGSYSFFVRVVDEIGNASEPSNTVDLLISGIAPTAATIVYPATESTAYISPLAPVTVIGLAQGADTVELVRDGNVLLQSVVNTTTTIVQSESVQGCPQPKLSPDGRYAICRIANGIDSYDLAIYDFDLQETRLLKQIPSVASYRVNWFTDSRRFTFTDFDQITLQPYTRIYNLLENDIVDFIDSSTWISREGIVSPDQQTILLIGSRNENGILSQGIFAIDLTTQSITQVVDFDYRRIIGRTLSWSPDGRYFTYYENVNNELHVVNLNGDDHRTVFSGSFGDPASWSPDSTQLLYGDDDNGGLYIYDVNNNQSTLVTGLDNTDYYYNIAWLTPNIITYLSDNNNTLNTYNLDAGIVTQIPFDSSLDLREWSRTGFITANRFDPLTGLNSVYRISPAGLFVLKDIELNVGDNTFTTFALNSDARSLESAAVNITYNIDTNLTVNSIRLVPELATTNSIANIVVQISNLGESAADVSRLSLVATDPHGMNIIIADNIEIPEISGNSNFNFSTAWDISDLAGVYTLRATIDTDNSVAEADETDNTFSRQQAVIGNGELLADINSDANSYQPGEQAQIQVSVNNGANEFNGNMLVRVEDANGFLVAELSNVVINSLAYADSVVNSLIWDTSNIFAGQYTIRVIVTDQENSEVTSAATSVTINAISEFAVNVVADQLSYSANADVLVTANIAYNQGNTLLQDLQATLRIVDDTNQVITEIVQAIPNMLPDTSSNAILNWNTGTQAVGAYYAELLLNDGQQNLAQALFAFNIIDNGINLKGNLSIDDNRLDFGENLDMQLVLTNQSNTRIEQLPVYISIQNPQTAALLLTESVNVDIDIASEQINTISLASNNLPVGNYTILLQTDINAQRVTLDSDIFTINDTVAPVVTLLAPVNNGYASGQSIYQIQAIDGLSLIDSVEYQVNGGIWFDVVNQDINTGEYTGLLPALSDGSYTIRARATDATFNTGYSEIFAFTVDSTLPAITITGVADGDVVNTDVIPLIEIFDINLNQSSVLLNGSAYTNGTVIAEEGDYILNVSASDLAGNLIQNNLSFTIDNTAPVINVTGINNGDSSSLAVTPIIEVTDSNLAESVITLNDAPFTSGTVVDTDSAYILNITATDTAGNNSSTTINFIIDSVAPLINIMGVNEGDVITSAAAIVDITDINLATSSVTLNGVPYISGTEINTIGNYILHVVATDTAGNSTETTVNFEIISGNQAPIANAGIDQIVEQQNASGAIVTLEGSLSNDPDGDTLSYIWSYGTSVVNGISPSVVLPEGSTDITLQVSDGELTSIDTVTVIVQDTTVPAITISGVIDNSLVDTAVTPVINISDINLDVSTITLNGTPFASGTSVTVDGQYVLVVTASDTAGNNTSETINFAIDSTAPIISVSGINDGEYSNANVAPLISIVDDNLNQSTITLNGIPYINGTPITEDGNYILIISANDNAGNNSTVTVNFVIDTVSPTIVVAGINDGDIVTDSVLPVITIDDINLATSSVTLNGADYISGTEITIIDTYVLLVEALDLAGNNHTETISFEITAANQAPVANAGINQTIEQQSPSGATVILDGSLSTDPDGDTLTYSWSSGSVIAEGVSPTVLLPAGSNTITLTVSDGELSASDDVVILIEDTTPPIISVPTDIIVTATGDLTPVDIGVASASDLVDGIVSVSNDAPTAFPVGETLVIWTATDLAGNASSATQRITITEGVCDNHNSSIWEWVPGESNLNLLGNAIENNDSLTLTNDLHQTGGVFWKTALPLYTSEGHLNTFSAEFSFIISDAKGISDHDGQGGDGLAFVINSHADELGAGGSGIGYRYLDNSVAVEFDTFKNSWYDRYSGNHVGINLGGNIRSKYQRSNRLGGRLNNGDIWYVWIDHKAEVKKLEIRISRTPNKPRHAYMRKRVNLANWISNDEMYIGFTSTTGAAGNTHEILDFRLDAEYLPNNPECEPPKFVSEPILKVQAGSEYRYHAQAQDQISGSDITYSLVTAPESMSVEADNGLLTWQPSVDDIGEHIVTIEAKGNTGLSVEQTYTLIVKPMMICYENFAYLADWQLNGSSHNLNPNYYNVLRLTDDLSQSGSAFIKEPVLLNAGSSFSTYFSFKMSHPFGAKEYDGRGADGIVFVMQTMANNVGGNGGGIGYEGINRSLGVEFDTWNNGSIDNYNGNHIGININGDMHSQAISPVYYRLNNGHRWHAWIDYKADHQRLEVRLSKGHNVRPYHTILQYEGLDLEALLEHESAYIGFTSGTGAAAENHDIVNFKFINQYSPIYSGNCSTH